MGTPAPDPARLVQVLRQGGEPAVVALLEAHGVVLNEYFRLMLGDESAVVRALTDTVVAALAHVGRLRDPRRLRAWLLALARVKAHEYYPAGWDAVGERHLDALRNRSSAPGPGGDALAVITDAALMRMWPDEREIFIVGSPRYGLPTIELAAIFGLADEQEAGALLADAARSFWPGLERSASEAGYVLPGDARRVTALIGAGPPTVEFSQILPFCVDPGLARLREDIASRVPDLGIDGFPATYGLTWPGREPVDQDAWPARRARDRKKILITAAAGTAIVAGAGVPLALAATIFGSPPVRGAPAQAAAPAGSPTAPAVATQSSGPPASVSPSPVTTTAAPARTTAASRTSPPPAPSPTPTKGKKPPPPSPSASPSPTPSPSSPTPTPSPTRHRGGG